ncbi:MAG: glycine cleavage system aminomethyltransferase GcvT [Muribaculaceae bacterium]|nr:glycine cleavage system aminomethyltransferase GcvT [Muribaculaceae bacterium]MDE5969177.1 glycine cleavage system aminomethyltransferase GcvT [Muribaculaceae bacterium]MDE7393393.1 glycine cleavage system aminomethyltransferase GcvT [Muribaculaceae bacterium]
MKTTCLHDLHKELGAQMSPFGGFDMPIQYEGIVEEHNAVREACGVFDVSHMGEVLVTGPRATEFVNYIFTNDVTAAAPGQCLYGMMLNEQGGVVDDLLVYVLENANYLLVINASNIDKDVNWILHHAKDFDCTVTNQSDDYGELAIQGPEAEKVITNVLGLEIDDLKFYTFKIIDFGQHRIIVSRTGYTGEDGFEIYADRELTRMFWSRLIASGQAKPCGLGCRDTLRFEVALPLYGDELADDITPLEAGLGIFVKLDKPDFIGRDAIAKQKAEGPARKIVGLEILDRAIARHGTEVLDPDGNVIGTVTTGYRGISVDKSLAMALIDARFAALGTKLQVKVRRKIFPAEVVSKKFYKKSYKK